MQFFEHLPLLPLLYVLIVHYIADFVLQTKWMAENKATDKEALLTHILVYTMTWVIFLPLSGLTIPEVTYFIMITGFCHYWTDYITSRQVKFWFNKKNYHNGFLWIGFDQILHYTQLVLTLNFLKSL